MGLLNKRNIAKVKSLAEKNKDKIAENVTKATGAIDAKTGGKYADKLKKVDDAAKKYAGVDDPAVDDPAADDPAADASDVASGAATHAGGPPTADTPTDDTPPTG